MPPPFHIECPRYVARPFLSLFAILNARAGTISPARPPRLPRIFTSIESPMLSVYWYARGFILCSPPPARRRYLREPLPPATLKACGP